MATFKTNKGNTIIVDDEDAHKISGLTLLENTWRNKPQVVISRSQLGMGIGTIRVARYLKETKDAKLFVVLADGTSYNFSQRNLLEVDRYTRHRQFVTKRRLYKGAPTLSKYRGVTNDYGRWRANFCHHGKIVCLGHFKTDEEAARAWDAKSFELHGSNALLNFPEEHQQTGSLQKTA